LSRLSIVGGGSWGTALATVLAPKFDRICLWVYEPDLAARMAQAHENDVYLADVKLPTNVDVTDSLLDAVENAEVIISAAPSQFLRSLYEQMLPALDPETLFVSATKGIETQTLQLPSEIISDVLSSRFSPQVAVLSGPSFAREVACGNPTAIVIASCNSAVAHSIQQAFSGPTFRLYTSSDPIGVQIGGSIKNVVAIGAGIVHGLDLGHNAMAALITRGLAEMTRLAVALGAQAQTLSGLAGLGDLVLTCTGELSRNRSVGLELARGRKLTEILASTQMIAEGVKTTNAAYELARRRSVEMPITEQMYQMINFDLPPAEAVRLLMERSLRGE
jgi:glycerol-3-phosphate dehydrogenase (NAD(P)+)